MKALRDSIAIILSVAAFALSALVAYFTTLVVKDDIRVVIGRAPTFLLKKKRRYHSIGNG
jgi:hypothetical protein